MLSKHHAPRNLKTPPCAPTCTLEFPAERWESTKTAYRQWWAGETRRPLIQITVNGARDPGRPAPALPQVARDVTSYDLAVTPEAIVDCWDYGLSRSRFLGDAFPRVNPDFGPGVIAAFMGAVAQPGNGTVWFHPATATPIETLSFGPGPDTVWLERVKAICRAAGERWQGRVQVDMTDLGGNLDILSTFRPGTELLLDLCDHPEDVQRLTGEAHTMWWRYYDEINAVLRPFNPGYTAWTPILSETPYYMLQCDFCYMIGPEMFDAFVKPELAASCKRLDHAFYHLDGPRQLPHLDSLLTIPDLDGVQWVPGSGQPPTLAWLDVYRRIRRAGKRAQIVGDMRDFDRVAEELGSAEGLYFIGGVGPERENEARALLRKYGVTP